MALSGTVFGTPQFRPLGAATVTGHGRVALRVMFTRLELALDAERGRWFLWLPVLFGCGVAIYLALPVEPPLPLAVAGVLLAIPLRIFLRLTALRLIVSSIFLMLALGFLDAKLRAMFIDAPVLQRTLRNVQLTGWVEHAERMDKRTRLTVRLISLERVTPEAMPRRVRVSLRGKAKTDPPAAGTAIRMHATLMPPPEPAIPGGFDFARNYWFSGLGASGYATAKPEALEGGPAPPWDLRLSAVINNFRQNIGNRVAAVVGGTSGAISQALIMGERGEIPESANVALRNSGLYHIISVSGEHMALTAGVAYWLIRALLALFPALALRFPVKIWAAIAALVIASAYLVISGSAVTAVRSHIMIAIMFIAVMLNRPALSLRNVAFSALLILVAMPECVTDAGFQMSFAATAALIAYFESHHRLRPPASWPPSVGVPFIRVIEALLTGMVATLAVDPIATYHFHRFAVYSALGNVMAEPAIALIVMPMAMLSLLAMPFGLEAWPLLAMDFGVKVMMWVAEFVGGLPGSSIPVPAFSDVAMALIVAGGLWLLIWHGRWRYWGLAAIGAGLAVAPFAERPDVWIDRDGRLMAVRGQNGEMAIVDTRRGAFSLTNWLQADGDGRVPKDLRKGADFQCDEQSCVVMVKGKLVSHVLQPGALTDDCARAAILIVSFPVRERCPQPHVVVDLADLREKGAHALRIGRDGVTMRTVADSRGARPWVVRHFRREVIPPVAAEAIARDNAGEAEPDAAGEERISP